MFAIESKHHSDKVVASFSKSIHRNEQAIAIVHKMLSTLLNDAGICEDFSWTLVRKPGLLLSLLLLLLLL